MHDFQLHMTVKGNLPPTDSVQDSDWQFILCDLFLMQTEDCSAQIPYYLKMSVRRHTGNIQKALQFIHNEYAKVMMTCFTRPDLLVSFVALLLCIFHLIDRQQSFNLANN